MEFLININIAWPEAMSDEEIREISVAERQRAAEFAEQGALVRMWRVPGRRENWGLWRAGDPTEMHDVISSLPAWSYMQVQVIPLADHPIDPVHR
ncbi:muconolactone Delta-isomerase [Leucobacter sp. wl10]|uniref:muconolactone Delta-isomerase n=1 Tax=Leucobacter sp. wl10 TaxID=2304677 RepID=UPI000E5A677D|nr:muconolactone Delta-isomerase family protein [Leucobacter sp. wl10]RGE23153.1 muconolactone delta-isomerase [Leucobacter sp. wl10]